GITIKGTTPGDGVAAGSYTQLSITGSINLNGAPLEVTYLATSAVGTTFTIVHTTAGVSGTFSGLSEGATVAAADGTRFTISYQGNGGRDVVLTHLGGPSVTTTTTTLQASATSVDQGQFVTFTATVSPTPSGGAADTVDFSDGQTDLG